VKKKSGNWELMKSKNETGMFGAGGIGFPDLLIA
jgi:hypothetical protein